MKILINGINFSPELTGIGKYTGELAEYLVEAGHEVRVVTAPPYYPQWQVLPGYTGWRYRREHRSGMVIYRCPLWVPRRPGGLKRILHLASFALSSFFPTVLLAGWKPDLVMSIAPAILSAPGALLAARMSGARAWLHIQDFEMDTAASLGMLPAQQRVIAWANRLEAWLLGRFDIVSSLSASMLARLDQKGVPANARQLLPNWVDTRQIKPLDGPSRLRAKLGIHPDQIVVLYAGNLGRKQGLDILIAAAGRIDDPNIQFVLCGDGAARTELQVQARGMPNLRFLPLQPAERLNDLLNLADIHILPQLASTADLVMPSKLSGMLASGKPVVATAESGTELYQIISQIGLAVPPMDLPRLVAAIHCLAGDQAERIRLGALGRRFVEQTWDKDIILRDFLSRIDPANEYRYRLRYRPGNKGYG